MRVDVVKGYLDRFPKLPTKTLADLLYRDHPLLFASAEAARTVVRYHRGQSGDQARLGLVDKTHVKPLTHNTNPYGLPKSYQLSPAVYHWPAEYSRIGILSDLHIPYHDIPALTAALDYLKYDFKATGILLNGDLMDFHGLSRYEHDPEKRTPKQEIRAGARFLKILRSKFRKAHIVFTEGNHDLRWASYLMKNAAHLYNDTGMTLGERLGAGALGITVLPDTSVVRMSGLAVLHGHTVAGNAASLYRKIGQAGLIGHGHKIDTFTKTSLDGTLVQTNTTGCLCELNPNYHPHANQYAHGMATVELLSPTVFKVQNIRIIDGVIQ